MRLSLFFRVYSFLIRVNSCILELIFIVPLYLVSTPIGNREDLSARAQKTLLEADLILCEDTRRTGYFLQSFGDKNKPLPPLLAFYEENERRKTPEIIKRLKEGQKIALVSSAGTLFLIRDFWCGKPSRRGRNNGYPGPCAATTALILRPAAG